VSGGAELTHRFNTYELGRELRYSGPALQDLRDEETMYAEQRQPDNHAGGERRVDGSDGGADESAAVEVQVAEGTGRTSFGTIKRWFGYTHFLLKGLEKSGRNGV